MTGQEPPKLEVEGVNEFWLQAAGAELDERTWRPALLIECSINFRSLRAGLNHSEERSCTAWLPEGNLAIDWDTPAIDPVRLSQPASRPLSNVRFFSGNYLTTRADIEQYESELIDKLVRSEKLRVFFNPVFGLFSAPEEPLDQFLARVAEAALSRVEPEMKHLRNRFELQLEQVREAHSARGAHREELSLESFISHKLHIFESENRLAAMFSTLAGAVFGTTEPRSDTEIYQADEAELREDLDRIEQEASEALGALYEEYLKLANEYDVFEIGLQPDNIQISRRTILWIPLSQGSEVGGQGSGKG
jgi:hypothetical protein